MGAFLWKDVNHFLCSTAGVHHPSQDFHSASLPLTQYVEGEYKPLLEACSDWKDTWSAPANCLQVASHFVGLFSAWPGCSLCLAELVPYGANASTSVCVCLTVQLKGSLQTMLCSQYLHELGTVLGWGFSHSSQVIGFFPHKISQSIRRHRQGPGTGWLLAGRKWLETVAGLCSAPSLSLSHPYVTLGSGLALGSEKCDKKERKKVSYPLLSLSAGVCWLAREERTKTEDLDRDHGDLHPFLANMLCSKRTRNMWKSLIFLLERGKTLNADISLACGFLEKWCVWKWACGVLMSTCDSQVRNSTLRAVVCVELHLTLPACLVFLGLTSSWLMAGTAA